MLTDEIRKENNMTRRLLVRTTVSIIAMACLIFVGCSDDSIIITNSPEAEGETLSEIQRMFPAEVGYRTIYKVTQANGASEIVTNTVGEEVIFGYSTAHEMHVRSNSGERYTNYFVFTDSALFFYEYWSDDPEKVLSVPLTTGSSWNKSDALSEISNDTTDVVADTTDNNTDNIKDGGGDLEDPKPGDDGNGGGANKNFPGNNAGDFTIEGFESLALSNGETFSGVIRVRNDGGELTNYYWFAPSVGLIRWVLDADQNDKYDGAEVGELIEYGFQSF